MEEPPVFLLANEGEDHHHRHHDSCSYNNDNRVVGGCWWLWWGLQSIIPGVIIYSGDSGGETESSQAESVREACSSSTSNLSSIASHAAVLARGSFISHECLKPHNPLTDNEFARHFIFPRKLNVNFLHHQFALWLLLDQERITSVSFGTWPSPTSSPTQP